MSSPYNIQYRKTSLERHRLMEKLKVVLVLAMVLGFSALVFSGFSSPAPARHFEDAPLQPALPFHGGTAPAWLREYSHAELIHNEGRSQIRPEAPMVVRPAEREVSKDARIGRITPIKADRGTLEKALRISGE